MLHHLMLLLLYQVIHSVDQVMLHQEIPVDHQVTEHQVMLEEHQVMLRKNRVLERNVRPCLLLPIQGRLFCAAQGSTCSYRPSRSELSGFGDQNLGAPRSTTSG